MGKCIFYEFADGLCWIDLWNFCVYFLYFVGDRDSLYGWIVLQIPFDCDYVAGWENVSVIGSRFTLRKGCLNPAIGLIFQMFAAIEKRNGMLFIYSFVLVVGTIIGGLLAFYIFKYVYAPLK